MDPKPNPKDEVPTSSSGPMKNEPTPERVEQEKRRHEAELLEELKKKPSSNYLHPLPE
jgi:hypothetical protein